MYFKLFFRVDFVYLSVVHKTQQKKNEIKKVTWWSRKSKEKKYIQVEQIFSFIKFNEMRAHNFSDTYASSPKSLTTLFC